MQFEAGSDNGGENLEEMLQDLTLEDQNNPGETYKNDSTMFIIDCSEEMMIPHAG